MRKLISLVSAILLLSVASWGNAGGCFDSAPDFDDCNVRAKGGDARAQFNLGVRYYKGQGVLQDYHKAFEWYSKAAVQGHDEAQFNLGTAYSEGEGVLQDYHKAFEWYSKAAAQGFASAQFNLGMRYYKGQGVSQDYVMAHMFWNLAAAQGDKGAAGARDDLAKLMTPSQIEEAQRRAREWFSNQNKI